MNSRVDELRKAGRFREAAVICLADEEYRLAAELFATEWDWDSAMNAALEGKLLALAYRYALEGESTAARRSLTETLSAFPDEALEAALFAEGKGRVGDAAVLREAAGDVLEAARLFEKAGDLFEAARCTERAGKAREAGMLYERRLAEDPGDAVAALRLGQILVQFGRWEHAARALQQSAEDPAQAAEALGLLIACFDALHMDQAAEAALERLAKRHNVPRDVGEFLERTFGDRRGLAGLARGEDAGELLAGRYRIERTLGSGASGRVLLGHDGFYERAVAIKVLNVAAGARGRDRYARFAREAHVAAGIDHANVVRVHEFNPDGPFLVMEFMAGGTLEERLEGGQPLPLNATRSIANGMLAGLSAVHRRGVIHRDLKPANVFFGATGDVKLGDFGVAHLQDLNSTLTGAMMGTLAYMAPEQITGRVNPQAGTDLYAFGVMLFRMLTGTLPLKGPDFVEAHLREVPATLSSVRPALGTRFDDLLSRLLAKELDERPASADEALALLDALDWTDPDHDQFQELVHIGAARAKPPSVAPQITAVSERYVLVEAREGGAYLAEDSLLARTVRIEPCDTERAKLLRAFGAADHAHLQAVFDVDTERERAVLEAPRGEPLGRTALSEEGRRRAKKQVLAALTSLHAHGLAHGHLRMSSVRIGAGRAVLLLPSVPGSDPSADLVALDALFPAE